MILKSLPIHAAAAATIAATLTSLVDATPLRHDARQVAETHRINSTHYNDTAAVVLDVWLKDTAARNDTSPLLYGWMFEDISVLPPFITVLKLLCRFCTRAFCFIC